MGESGTEGTLLSHQESFSGILAFMMGNSSLAKWMGQKEKTEAGFHDFNKRFKSWVEQTAGGIA